MLNDDEHEMHTSNSTAEQMFTVYSIEKKLQFSLHTLPIILFKINLCIRRSWAPFSYHMFVFVFQLP